jgi:hypothetical protein
MGLVPSVSFLGGFLSFQGYVALQDRSHSSSTLGNNGEWANLPFGVKVQGIVGSFDLSASWIKEVLYLSESASFSRNHYIGMDFAGAIWDFGVYGEAALMLWDEAEEKPAYVDQEFGDLLEICAGFDYLIPVLEIDSRVEYFHYGPASGKNEGYLLVYLERIFFDYLTVSIAGALNGGSLGFFPELSGEPYGNFEVGVGAMLIIGEGGSELDLIDPAVYLRCKLSF